MLDSVRSNVPRGWEPSWRRPGAALLPEEVGRPHLRRENPIYAGNLEGITQALYDIYAVTTDTALPSLTLFQNPAGQTYGFGGLSFAKTFDHTNLTQAGMLEAPNKHIMRAISFFVMGVPAASGGNSMVHPEDLSQLLSVSFQLNINRKSYQDTIIGRVPAGGGIHLQGSLAIYDQGAATVDGFQTATNGWPTRDNTYALAYGGIPLEQAQNFNVVINPLLSNATLTTVNGTVGGIAGTGIFCWAFLDGTLFRAVQ